MAYTAWSVVFGEQPSAAKWNILGTNDASFNNGTGIGNNAIAAASLATNAITLGYASITTSDFNTASVTPVLITGLSVAVTIPAGGRKVKITGFTTAFYIDSSNRADLSIWDGTVGSGTQLSKAYSHQSIGGGTNSGIVIAVVTPSAGSKTYSLGLAAGSGAGTAHIQTEGANSPGFILVETI